MLDPHALKAFLAMGSNTIFGLMDMFSGGAFGNATIFAMGINPYINASIIVQLLIVAIPSLEKMQKDGEDGRKKISRFQRVLAIVLAIVEGVGLFLLLRSYGIVAKTDIFDASIIVATFTAGTAFLMWLGDRITEKGVGNGISILIFAGIVSRIPSMISGLGKTLGSVGTQTKAVLIALTLLLVIVLVTMLVVLMDDAERRIPVQYTKRVAGRKAYGAQNSHIPIKLSAGGVTPIIFAMSIMMFPATIAQLFGVSAEGSGFWGKFLKAISPSSWIYALLYFLMIIFFTYFYAAIQFNPPEMSNNMKKNGGFIPGIRPGKPTAEYIAKVLSRVTLVGALFLGFIAVLPIVVNYRFHFRNFGVGGTSLLIVVGVALETIRQIGSQMVVRTHKGFLE
jgi:preprotein translocase subunit SecY